MEGQFLHNTGIKKNASELFETDITDNTQIDSINPVIQPTVEIEPTLIFEGTDASGATTTIMTTPPDKNFFLTNIQLSGTNTTTLADTVCSVDFVVLNGQTKRFVVRVPAAPDGVVTTGGTGASLAQYFPKRGILLQKGSNIILTKSCDNAWASIAGYIGSDRSA